MLTNLQKLGRDAYFGNGAKSSAECDISKWNDAKRAEEHDRVKHSY